MNIDEWISDLRYRSYDDWDDIYIQELTKTVARSTWRLDYHIQPPTGLLNDPNGFSYFNGRWHLFYQYFPFGPVHGLKSWYHLSSANLVDWRDEGFGLLPDSAYDSHGVYSGTALPIDDQLLLAYTGNVRGENWERLSYQMGAWMDQDNQVTKIEPPLIAAPPAGYTQHFRDPQVIRYGEGYLLLIGAQTDKEEGKVLVYQSASISDWQFLGELAFTDDSMGFMIECPNLIFIDQKPVLIFCPQGMPKDKLPYQNIYPNTVVVGDAFDLEKVTLTNPQALQNLDDGFDAYATQVINAPDGRVLSVGWAGLPELVYPTDNEGWAHCLTLVHELSLKGNRLYQQPITELKELRQQQTTLQGSFDSLQSLGGTTNNRYELKLTLSADSRGTLHLFADAQNQHSLALHFDQQTGQLILDRSRVSLPFAEEFGTTRTISVAAEQPLELHIFADHSLCEIFVNGGHSVFTSRIFPQEGENQLFLEGQGTYEGNYWELRAALEA